MLTVSPETTNFVNAKLKAIIAGGAPYSEEFNGIDFSRTSKALVVNVAVVCEEGLLLALRRTAQNDSGIGLYNNVAGYMQGRGDSDTTVNDTVAAELGEEAGLTLAEAVEARAGQPIEVTLPGRTLHVVPALVCYKHRPEVILNEEHDEARWVTHQEFLGLSRIPVVDQVLEQMLGQAPRLY